MPLDLDKALANIKRVPRASEAQLEFVFFVKEHPEYEFLGCIEPIHVYIIAQVAHHVGPKAVQKLRDAFEFGGCLCGPTPNCECEAEKTKCPECPSCQDKTAIIPPITPPSIIIPPIIIPPPPGANCEFVGYEKAEWNGQSSNLRDD